MRCTAPPPAGTLASTRRSCILVAKQIHCPSGDQHGEDSSSGENVNCLKSVPSALHTQTFGLPLRLKIIASLEPSGETAALGVQAGKPGDDAALAGRKVVVKNVRVARLIRRVINREPAGHPRRRGDNRVVMRDGLRVVAVEIRNVNFAVAGRCLRLERDLGLADSFFSGDGQHDVVRERVRLPPQTRAVVAARKFRLPADGVRHVALHVAGAAAADPVLRGFRRDEAEALDVKIKSQNVQRLAGETFERNGNRLGLTHDGNFALNVDFFLRAAKIQRDERENDGQND